jgi:negative regulator of flagellin synthesis FlgM
LLAQYREEKAMQVNGPSSVHGAQGINAPHFTQRTQGSQATTSTQATDRVEISPAAEAASKAAEAGGVRTDLVNSIRQQIAAGTYDTPDKMDAALSRLLDQVG